MSSSIEDQLKALPEPDLTDPDNPELTDADFARMRPAHELPPEILAQFPNTRVRGRPRLDAPKKHVSLRLSPEVLDHYRALGTGWQAQIETDLRKSMAGRQKARRSGP